MTIFCSKQDTM